MAKPLKREKKKERKKDQEGNLGKERVEGFSLHASQKDFVIKMFLDYSKVTTLEHFENTGEKAVSRRSKSSVLAKADQQSSGLAPWG